MTEQEKEIEGILKHKVYTQLTSGQERIDGLLGEFYEMGWTTEEKYHQNKGKSHVFDTVQSVLDYIEKP